MNVVLVIKLGMILEAFFEHVHVVACTASCSVHGGLSVYKATQHTFIVHVQSNTTYNVCIHARILVESQLKCT